VLEGIESNFYLNDSLHDDLESDEFKKKSIEDAVSSQLREQTNPLSPLPPKLTASSSI
jgi:hypothetical protein